MTPTINPTFSVITACYKGSNFLPRAFKSLLRQQGGHSIEWIIVDDFSNDGNQSKRAIEQIEKESPFPVKSIYLDANFHGTKCTYIAAQHAHGAYSIILDQDDMLSDNALELFSKIINLHDGDDNFAGVCGRSVNMDGEFLGTLFPWSGKLSNELHIRHIDKIKGELCQCTKSHLLIEYFEGMKPGYTNGWAWNRMARKYQFFYTNDIVRIYDTVNPSSVSNNKHKRLAYLGAMLEQLSYYLIVNSDYFIHDRKYFIRLLIAWSRIGFHQKKLFRDQLKLLPTCYHMMFRLIYPIAVLRAKIDKINGRV